MIPSVHRFEDARDLADQAARLCVAQAKAAVAERGRFAMAISGGTSPRGLFESLALESFSAEMPWADTHIFWADERLVSPKHPDSNFGMAHGLMLSKVPIPEPNVHRVPVELINPNVIAQTYQDEIAKFFEGATEWPLFDLILLGLGEDGHTASLFPGSRALDSKAWVAPVLSPGMEPKHSRITMTLELINRTRCAAFIVVGEGKKGIVDRILAGGAPMQPLPAALVRPLSDMEWFLAYV